jgi:hypothetical protein
MRDLDLARDILDLQLVDADGQRCGRADGVVLELGDGPPRVVAIEQGWSVLAERLHPRLERWLAGLRRRVRVRRTARFEIAWETVSAVTFHHLKVEIDGLRSPTGDWERWLRRKVVDHLPGGKEREEGAK